MTWLEKFLIATKESESPTKYWYWAGLTAISGVVNNKVFLDKFYYKLYPNLYVILIGKSGMRKGPPVAIAKTLVEEVDNTRVISGRNTIQSIIRDLSVAITKQNGGPPILDAIGFVAAPEFASFMIQDPQALTVLTDLFDPHREWINTTKGGGQEKLKNPCLTMIGASNEVHFKDAVPDNALGGGFIGRTFLIHADKKANINPLTEKPAEFLPIKELAVRLKEIAKLRGSFEWTSDGRARYNEWYREFSETDYGDNTGTLDRIHDNILKVSMLLSLSRGDDLLLKSDDIEEAVKVSLEHIPGARKVTMGGGKNPLARGTALVLKELILDPDHRILHSRLLSKHWGEFDTYDLDRITESLIQQRAITVEQQGINKWYRLTAKTLENYSKLKKES